MSPGQWVAHHPFLTIAVIAGLVLAARTWNIGNEQVMDWMWLILGYGFHAVEGWLNNILPDLDGWIHIALTVTLGLILYLLLDVLWQRIRPS